MDDARRTPFRLCLAAGLALIFSSLAGCSLVIMANKMLFGDPVVTSAFRRATGADLVKSGEKVLVVCSVPHGVKSRFEGAGYEIVQKVTRQLARQDIKVVDSNDVAEWMDNNGGMWDSPEELARAFATDYIVHIDLKQFSYEEPNSPNMYRARIAGTVYGFSVEGEGEEKHAWEVFSYGYSLTHPATRPFSREEIPTPEVFLRTCVDRASIELAQLFYDHRLSDEVL